MANLATQSQINQIPPERAQRAEVMINWLFGELKSIFPGWRAAFETEADYLSAKQTWLRVLVQEKITKAQLDKGLSAAEKSLDKFLPSVGLFVSWCKAYDYHELGLPTLEELEPRLRKYFGYAKFDAHKFDFRSPQEYYLLHTLYYKYANKHWDDCLKAMPKVLADTAEKVRQGFPFDPIPEFIEEKPKYIDPQVAVNGIAKIRAIMEGRNDF